MSTCNIFIVLVPCQNRPHIDYILMFLRAYRNPFTHKKEKVSNSFMADKINYSAVHKSCLFNHKKKQKGF